MNADIEARLNRIESKLDQLLAVVEELRGARRVKAEARKAKKEKLPPLTQEEIASHQARFGQLFDKWMAGSELEVQSELEGLDVEQLRRFADANNLNVTSRMPAQKVLLLVAARFREKRQLLSGMARRSEAAGP